MTLKEGTRVQYSLAHLQRTTGGDPFCHLWQASGTVQGPGWREGITLVLWDGDLDPIGVCTEYLAIPGSDKHCRIDAKGWVGHEALGEKPRSKFQ